MCNFPESRTSTRVVELKTAKPGRPAFQYLNQAPGIEGTLTRQATNVMSILRTSRTWCQQVREVASASTEKTRP